MLRRLAPDFIREPGAAELVAGAVRWFSIPGGTNLMQKGDPSDSICIVANGLLGVVIDTPAGGESMIAKLGPGEVVGEMGCITGEPRSATVRALRSSEILEITWADIERVAMKDPGVLRSICRTVVQRMVRAQEGRLPTFRPSTFALVALGDAVDGRGFAERFKDALSTVGNAFLVTREEYQNATTDEVNQIEKAHDYVIYFAEESRPSWINRCVRQADAVLALGKGGQPPRQIPGAKAIVGPNTSVILILDWESGLQPTNTGAWMEAVGASRQFHVRGPADIRRVARLLTGNGFGLVLSGGGARGIAHIGVMRALGEHGIEIDVVMGTSMGAIVGAGVALEWNVESMVEKIHRFIRTSALVEITVPRTSILAGRNMRRSFRNWFGDLRIEDLPIPYSCVSTNLTTGDVAVHQAGDLKTWLQASAAVPGVFPPVIVDGIVYVDGGVLNNMPTDLIREQGAGFVLAIDVGGGSTAEAAAAGLLDLIDPAALNLFELLTRVGSIGDGARAKTRRRECDVLIVPGMADIGLLNFKAYERALKAGYRATVERIAEIAGRTPRAAAPDPAAAQF